MKNVAALTEDGAFALFFCPHPGGFDSSRVPTPGNLPSKAKKNANTRGSARGGGGVLGAGGIDWCIRMSRWTVLFSSLIPASRTRQIDKTFMKGLLTTQDQELCKSHDKRKPRQ